MRSKIPNLFINFRNGQMKAFLSQDLCSLLLLEIEELLQKFLQAHKGQQANPVMERIAENEVRDFLYAAAYRNQLRFDDYLQVWRYLL